MLALIVQFDMMMIGTVCQARPESRRRVMFGQALLAAPAHLACVTCAATQGKPAAGFTAFTVNGRAASGLSGVQYCC